MAKVDLRDDISFHLA